MAFFTQNKFNYTTGVPDGNDVYPSVSSTWGDDGAGVLGNGTIAFPTAAGGAGQVLTDVGGTGVLTFADAPSTPPSGILGSVQLSDGAGGFTSDQPSFNYNSTTKRLGVGKVATTSLDVLEDSIGVNAFFENVSGSDFDTAVGLKLKHRTTIDMEATFGIAQEFYLEDDTSGELLAGSVGFERVDSDSERRYVVKGGTNGTQELFSIDSNREFTVEKGLRNGFGVDSLSGVSDDALAWNINDANAAAIIANAGSGIGLRVIANSGNILSLEDTNEVAQVLVSNTGLVTFNDAANATADFEVKAQTSGTALLVDVSTGWSAFGGASTNLIGIASSRGITVSGPVSSNVAPVMEFYLPDSTDTDGQFIGFNNYVSGDVSSTSGQIGLFGMHLDGGTAGNRGGAFEWRTKKNGLPGLNINLELDNQGTLVVNPENDDFSSFQINDDTGVLFSSDPLNRGITINHTNTAIALLDVRDNGTLHGSVFISAADDENKNIFAFGNLTDNADPTFGFRGYILNSGVLNLEYNKVGILTATQTGPIVFNPGATSGRDFEVLAETTGTALFVDVSTGRTGFGTDTPGGVIHTVGSSPPIFQRENANNNVLQAGIDLLHKTSVDALDGLGPSVRFGLQDDTSAYEVLGEIGAVRDGADNQGKLVFRAGIDGLEEALTIDSNLKVNFFGTIGTIHVVDSSPPIFQRENSINNSPQAGIDLLHKTSLDALDGLGPSVRFAIQDDTSAYEVIGEIAAVRDGADNEGKIIFKAGTNGSEQMASIDAAGTFTLEQGVVSLKETTTPTSVTDYGKVYAKADNKLYFQDGAGAEHEIAFV